MLSTETRNELIEQLITNKVESMGISELKLFVSEVYSDGPIFQPYSEYTDNELIEEFYEVFIEYYEDPGESLEFYHYLIAEMAENTILSSSKE